MPATSQEQLLLELINEARIDPLASADRFISSYSPLTSGDPDIQAAFNQFKVSGTALKAVLSELEATGPLAWSDQLAAAAEKHSAAMIAADTESHLIDGEASLGSRLLAEGYEFNLLGENIDAFGKSILQTHAGLFVDWGTGPNGIASPTANRNNIMWSSLSEIGINVTPESDPQTDVGPLVVTQDFGDRGLMFVTGVAYNDTDGNDFYSVGEGVGGMIVSNSAGGTSTADSGGYSLAVSPGLQTLRFAGGELAEAIFVKTLVEFESVKLDIVNGDTLLTTASVIVDGPISVIRAKGTISFGLSITADQGNQEIYGYVGRDTLDGGSGSDKLFGGDNRDTLIGGAGNDHLHGEAGNDTLIGGTGKDIGYFAGNHTQYSITSTPVGDLTVSGSIDGTDQLTGVEVLRFADGDFVWDNTAKALKPLNNAAPVTAATQAVSTNEDTAKTITVAGTDAENDPIAYSAGEASHGTVTGGNNGVFIYSPDANYFGTDSFVVTLDDGFNGFATQTITVTVNPVNDAPVVPPTQTLTIAVGGTAIVTIPATDPDGDTLTFTPGAAANGTVTQGDGVILYDPDAGFAGTDSFSVSVSDGKGGSAQQQVSVNVEATFRLFTSDGLAATAGGTGTVFGTNGFQDITLAEVPGLVSFDASFNRGGDIVRMPGDADEYTIGLNGSAAVLDHAGATYIIPVGTVGISLVFDDGVRKLLFDETAQQVKIGTQTVDDTHFQITSASDGTPLPGGANPQADGRFLLGAGAKVTVGGDAALVGTGSGHEDVSYLFGDLTLDPSFNQGGDTLHVPGAATDYSAYLLGSAIVLLGPDGSVTIPVGTTGMTLDFGGDERTLRFDADAGAVRIGDQTIVETAPVFAEQLDAANQKTLSIDQGTAQNQVDIHLGTGLSYFLTDTASNNTNVRLSGFDDNDLIVVTGATSSQYNFSQTDVDGDGTAGDLVISYSNGNTFNLIEILDAVDPGASVENFATAQAAVGHNFIAFG
ncbi:MAG: cadherin-like domain-containing protein [Novosphingobium sp.]|nr:cadherin-like domain-containing protein [Novosphingobium sp.]